MPAETVEVVRRAIAALNERDIDRYLACCTEAVQLQTPWTAVEGIYEGPDGIRRFFSNLGDTMPDFRLEIERLEAVGTTRVLALLLVHATARASGIAAGEAAGGFPSRTANIYDLADGKIERIRIFLDRTEALDVAGQRG
jgi:ketosteroid isomerase-like protein